MTQSTLSSAVQQVLASWLTPIVGKGPQALVSGCSSASCADARLAPRPPKATTPCSPAAVSVRSATPAGACWLSFSALHASVSVVAKTENHSWVELHGLVMALPHARVLDG